MYLEKFLHGKKYVFAGEPEKSITSNSGKQNNKYKSLEKLEFPSIWKRTLGLTVSKPATYWGAFFYYWLEHGNPASL